MGRKAKAAVEEELEEVDATEPDDDEAAAAARFSTAQFLDPGWKPPPKLSPFERKVTNKYIPLFPDATKSPKQHAAAIKIYKSNPPGEGYKGTSTSPETVDEAYIAGLYGDGRYRLELLDQAKGVLRVREDVVVACGASPTNGASNGHGSTDIEAVVTRLTAQSEAALTKVLEATEQRLEREEARLTAERAEGRARSTEHTTLLTGLVKGEAEQLRAHYAAQQAAAAAAGQQQMAMMQQSHEHMMAIVVASQNAQAARSDPLLFLRVFQEGMQNSPEDGASKVVGDITKGLESLRGLANAPGGNLAPGAPPAKGLPAAANGAAPAKKNGKVAELSKDDLKEIVLLKRVLKARGATDADFLKLVQSAKAEYADPNSPVNEEVDDDDDDEETDEERAERLRKRKKAADATKPDPAPKPADDVDGAKPPVA